MNIAVSLSTVGLMCYVLPRKLCYARKDCCSAYCI